MSNKKNSTNPQQPETTPRSIAPDGNWLMTAINDLNGSMRALEQSIQGVQEKVKSIEQKLDKVDEKVCGIDKKVYAAGAIIVLIVAVGGFLTHKLTDYLIDTAKEDRAAVQQSNHTQSLKKEE